MKKTLVLFTMILMIVTITLTSTVSTLSADSFDKVLQRWTQYRRYVDKEDMLSNVTVTATYYSAEFIEAYIQKEAKANLWTQDELEDYKYNFVKALRLNEAIPIQLKIENNAPPMYLGPLDIFAKLRIGRKTYKPIDYDKRFNFKLQGEREGMIFFPRYDEKTGKDLLKDEKYVTFELPASISIIIQSTNTEFKWNVENDDPSKLFKGKTADKLETDRLLQRLEKLRKDEAEIKAKEETVDSEIDIIQKRLDEIGKN